MAAMPDLKVKVQTEFADAGALVIRPGDVLVIRYDYNVSMASADEVKRRVMARLPGLADVLVIGSAQQLAAYRPDGMTAGQPEDAPR